MAMDLTSAWAIHGELRRHLGHKVAVASYGDGDNMVIECTTCSEILVDADADAVAPASTNPVTVMMLRGDWMDRPGLTDEDKAALEALPDATLQEALGNAFERDWQTIWWQILDETRNDATRALLDRLGRDSSNT
jgi:hypothetical protein